MPIYEYMCEDCGMVSEFLIGVGKGDTEIRCRDCGSIKMHQKLSASNFSINGHLISSQGGKTCCGKEERCNTPPCSTGGICKR